MQQFLIAQEADDSHGGEMTFPSFHPFLFMIAVGLAASYGEVELPVRVDFEDLKVGPLAPDDLPYLFGQIHWEKLNDRAMVVATGEPEIKQVLEVAYPEGGYGSKRSGASFVSKLPPRQEYYLTYRIRFSDGFPFNKGGKLPGLSSSGSEFTGGRLPPKTGGWSARYMWRRKGDLELYLYHPKMKGPTGERVALDFRCQPATWYTLTQRIRVNDPGKSNGLIQVWIDGTRHLDLTDLYLRGEDVGLADSFLFSTFFGGGSKDWAPDSDCSIQFDSFTISGPKPN